MELYKLDSKAKIRVLNIDANWSTLVQRSGLIDWKHVTAEKEISEKNIWKANYQTAEEACISAAEALIVKKLREWYYTTIEEAEWDVMVKPTLAEKYKDHKHNIDFKSSYIQPKLDWMRCFTSLDWNWTVVMKSRTQKILSSQDNDILKHIEDELKLYRGMPIIIDWELYAHGFDLQENMKMVKKFVPGMTDKHIKYNIYDTIDEQPFYIRVNRTWFYGENVVPVRTERVWDEEKIEAYHKEFIEAWYEGSVIRYWEQSYEMRRTQKMLKKKDFDDVAAKVLDVLPQEADPTKWKMLLELIEWEHIWVEFLCSYNGTHEEQRDLLSNKQEYIWKTVEVRFFGYTQDGVPNIAKVTAFRLDK